MNFILQGLFSFGSCSFIHIWLMPPFGHILVAALTQETLHFLPEIAPSIEHTVALTVNSTLLTAEP
jgi:hypothetical protein